MALKAFFAFLVLFWFAFCEAQAENCSEVQCDIFPVGEEIASEFRHKASEKGVRLVYINLIIGNATYDPLDLPDEFLPHRWVWANTIKEPMLTLPDDYDILSFGLLNYQVRSMDVKLEDQPSGCLANLISTCQNMAIGRLLLENVTIKSTAEQVRKKPVVCVEVITTDDYYAGIRHIDHHQCCGMHQEPTGSATIRCDQTVDIGYWMDNFFFGFFSGILSFFLPALPLALPDCVFSRRAECEKEKRLEEQNNTGTPGDHQNINGTTDEPDNPSAQELSLRNRHSSYQQISDSDHDASNPRENISEQIEEESETIPVDDSSPMNLSTLLNGCVQKLPDIEMSFNIKLAILLLCICPSVLYVYIGLQRTVKTMYVNEIIKKDVAYLPVSGLSVLAIIILFISVLILRPRDFIFEKVITCMLCRKKSDRLSVGDKIRCHLKTLNHHLWEYIHCFGDVVVCDKCVCPNSCRKMRQKSQLLRHLDQVTVACGKYVCPNSCRKMRQKSQLLQLICNFGDVVTVCSKCTCLYACRKTGKRRQKSRLIQLICVLLRLISFTTALLLRILFGAICFVVLLFVSVCDVILFSPSTTIFIFLLTKVKIYYLALDPRPVSALFAGSLAFLYFCFFSSALYVGYSVIAVSTVCINNVLGYTIMGLVLNVDIVTPYVAFFVVLTTNLYLCYSNMQSKYKKVKKMIWKRKEDLQVNSRHIKNTIQVQLYWQVCDKVLPIKTEICVMFRNMGLVLLFLFLVAYSIAFFGREYDVSFVTSTVYLFFSGAIPPLVLRRLTSSDKIIGWTKIKMERQIGIVVEEYRDSSDAGVVTQSPV